MTTILAVVVWLAALLSPMRAWDRPGFEPGLDLALLTFNIRYGTAADGPDAWSNRRGQVFDLIRDLPYDVVCLQEALRFQLDEIEAAVPGFAEVGVGREDGRTEGEYSAILFKANRFSVAESGTFWLSETPEVPGSRTWRAANVRICTWARLIEKGSGQGVYLYCTHWDHVSQEAREKSAELITRRIAARAFPDPVILAGDLNSAEDNPAVAALKGDEASPRLVDTFRVALPDEADIQTFNGFRPREEWGRGKIDYILAPPGVAVEAAWIDRRERDGHYPSDHFPVGARITLSVSK